MWKTTLLVCLLALSPAAFAGQFTVHVNAGDGHGHVRMHFVYNADGCRGDDVAPAIRWSDAPKGTRSFAVTLYDPDAVGGWWHWVVVDVSAITHQLKEGAELPPGAYALTNSFGHKRYDGPCPPKADPPHHYVFTVYALDTASLGLPPDTSPAAAKAAIEQHAIGKASVTLTYGR